MSKTSNHSIRVSQEALLPVIISLENKVKNLSISYDGELVILFEYSNESENDDIVVDSSILKRDPRVSKDILLTREFLTREISIEDIN